MLMIILCNMKLFEHLKHLKGWLRQSHHLSWERDSKSNNRNKRNLNLNLFTLSSLVNCSLQMINNHYEFTDNDGDGDNVYERVNNLHKRKLKFVKIKMMSKVNFHLHQTMKMLTNFLEYEIKTITLKTICELKSTKSQHWSTRWD